MIGSLIPQEVLDAWNVVAEYLHKNQAIVLWLDIEVENNKNIVYTLKDLDGFRLASKSIEVTEDYLVENK
jgi:hypothetical protein